MEQDIEIGVSPEFAALLKKVTDEFTAKQEVDAMFAVPLPKHLEHMFR